MGGLLRSIFALLLAASTAIFAPTALAQGEATKIILALDTSGSMRGGGIETVKAAAQKLIERLPQDSQLSIYIFTNRVSLIQDFTAQKEVLRKSLNQITGGGKTSLYDSAIELADLARSNRASLIIFTDGRDSSSNSTSTALSSFVLTSKIRLSFVTYLLPATQRSILEPIASNSGGALYNATTIESLIQSFTSAIDDSTRERQSATTMVTEVPTEPHQSNSMLFPPILGLSTSLIAAAILLFLNRLRRERNSFDSWEDLLSSYEPRKRITVDEKKTSPWSIRGQRLVHILIGDITYLLPHDSNIRARYLILILTFLGTLLVLLSSSLPILFSLILALILFTFALRFYIHRKHESVLIAFETDLPGSLKLLAASLASGLSFLQAIETFSLENKSEVARQFRRALSEIQMGAPVERALNGIAQRMKSKDLEWAVFAFSVQREVGGSLAKILATAAETLESRTELRREVRTLSAEGRISSYVLMALPIGIFLFLLFTRPQFISMFWEEQIGHILLALIATGMFFAWIWIRRLIRISV